MIRFMTSVFEEGGENTSLFALLFIQNTRKKEKRTLLRQLLSSLQMCNHKKNVGKTKGLSKYIAINILATRNISIMCKLIYDYLVRNQTQ